MSEDIKQNLYASRPIVSHHAFGLEWVQKACGQYNGQACFNASRYESDLNEDCTFDPEILQNLETNILDDKNNDNELEISE
ncbi:hypothetical protein TNCV_4331221 [Trichonephila clavipes]|nr:hypothetical protein TNCV_4331221 [Trichonephila clavipes]